MFQFSSNGSQQSIHNVTCNNTPEAKCVFTLSGGPPGIMRRTFQLSKRELSRREKLNPFFREKTQYDLRIKAHVRRIVSSCDV